ncbi:hypothetical protein [Candidatus Albibeggiatoa sp. nov. NOAA]|uniref:hypothetical protein n=1 Tax=Candidatus Albibeggiatoa sp. nov. NOAA TaxID=3162724 RepID=UPI0032FA39BC|nr:hypothetical protein [Thiotrichaceae bacterium]
MKLKRITAAILLSGLMGSSAFAADSVTLSAGGPGAKETDYTITFNGTAGNTWTYSVYREAGSNARTLSHWSLGVGSCNIVSTTGSGAQTGNGGSANADGVLAGQPLVKWNTDVSTDPSNPTVFTFTLDGEYGSEQVAVVAKTGGSIKIDDGLITGPDCSNPLSGGDSGSGDSGSGDSGSGDSGACGITGGDAVTLAAGGPGAKETDYTITFEGAAGDTWTYSVYREAGSDARTLSHWSLGMGSCNVVSTTGSGAQTGNGGSANADGDLAGQPLVKWNTDVSTDPSNPTVFTFTLDGNYGAASVPVVAKTGGSIKIDNGTITGPDCSIPAPTDCGDSGDGGTGDSGDGSDDGTLGSGDSTPVTLTCPAGTDMLGHFDWNGTSYVLNGENVGGIAITGGVEGASAAGANWAASSGTVSAILVASSDNSASETLNDTVSGSFSNSALGDDIVSVMFCGTEGEQDDLAVALPAQGSVVGRVWALACENDCDEFLSASEVALDDADHVLEVIQPNGQVLFIPVSILK